VITPTRHPREAAERREWSSAPSCDGRAKRERRIGQRILGRARPRRSSAANARQSRGSAGRECIELPRTLPASRYGARPREELTFR
jgi:hypothetical protein